MKSDKQIYRIAIIPFITCLLICSSCDDCTTRIDNMKIHSVVSNTTTEASSLSGWHHSEFQDGKLHFTLEFDHYTGGTGDCSWFNYPLIETLELRSNRTLYTQSDTINAYKSLIDFFDIDVHDNDSRFITILLSEKAEFTFQYDKEYYTFTTRILTDDGLDMEDSCIVKITE